MTILNRTINYSQGPKNNFRDIETPSIDRNLNLMKANLSQVPEVLIIFNVQCFLYGVENKPEFLVSEKLEASSHSFRKVRTSQRRKLQCVFFYEDKSICSFDLHKIVSD